MQNRVRRRSYDLNLCEAHGLTSGQFTHIHEKWQKNQCYAEKFVLLVVQGFDELVLPALPHVRLWHRDRRTKKIDVSSNNTKWEYEWINIRRLVTNPVTGRRTSTERPVAAWIPMRKRTYTHFLKDWNCAMQEFLDSMQETHRWSHTSSRKIWENW